MFKKARQEHVHHFLPLSLKGVDMVPLTQLPPQTNDYREIQRQKESFQQKPSLSVSIIIPFYKERHILARTLASLVYQTYPSHLFEVIVSDDGSSEPVIETLEIFKEQLTLQYVRQEDLGFRVCAARNLGLQRAQGEVIISLDFDMICPPEFIAAHLTWFHVSDRVATIGPRKFIDAKDIAISDIRSNFARIAQLPSQSSISNYKKDIDGRIAQFANFYKHPFPAKLFHTCNVAYRRSHSQLIGGFDEAYDYHYGFEDVDFGHRLWLAGIFLVPEAAALAYHQENEVISWEERNKGGSVNVARFFKKFPDTRQKIWATRQ